MARDALDDLVDRIGPERPDLLAPRLIAFLQDEERGPVPRGKAARLLGELTDEAAIPHLVDALEDLDWFVREGAIAGLVAQNAVDHVHAIVKAAPDDASSRFPALVSQLGAAVVGPLVEALGDHDRNVAAAETLGTIGEAALPALIEVLRDGTVIQRSFATDALAKIGGPAAIRALHVALGDEDDDVRGGAIYALGKIGGPDVVGPLIEALEDDYWRMNRWVEDSIKFESNRREAAQALAALGDKRAIEPLKAKLTDWYSNQAIAKALSQLGWAPTNERESVQLWIAQRDWHRHLRDTWPKHRNVLLDDLTSRDPDATELWQSRTIENALFTFIAIGDAESLPLLTNVLEAKGDRLLAESYLNSGNSVLAEAATRWAAAHGYTIEKGDGVHPVSWGRF